MFGILIILTRLPARVDTLHQNLRSKLVYETRECQDVTISFALDEIFFFNYFFVRGTKWWSFVPYTYFEMYIP